MSRPLITLSSDFGVQTQGVGSMEAVAFEICPEAKIVHLMHGIAEFDFIAAARTMESVRTIPVGFHVCVCDPGVGTKRRGIALQVKRGDIFVGPDNGIFLPVARLLGGITKVHELREAKYQHQPVSPIFHGRDIFAPAAAHLASGVPIENFGPAISPSELAAAPYEEARTEDDKIISQVIQINRFGSIHLNILHEQWDQFNIPLGEKISVQFPNTSIEATYTRTFGEVSKNEIVIMRDDYGRVEIAVNMGSFVKRCPVSIGDRVVVHLG